MPFKKMGVFLVLFSLAVATAGGATLPFPSELLNDEHRKPLREVVEDFTVHREVSGLRLSGRQAVFEHLLRHPDFAASLARAAGVLKYTVERRGEATFWTNDHKGLAGTLEILPAREGQVVIYAQGKYEKGIIRIPGRLALVVNSSEERNEDSFYVENTLSGYVRFDGTVVESLVRLFRPFVYRIMEKRARWFFKKVNRLMTRLYEDPEAVLQKLPADTWENEAAQLRVLLTTPQLGLDHRPQTENLTRPRGSNSKPLLHTRFAFTVNATILISPLVDAPMP